MINQRLNHAFVVGQLAGEGFMPSRAKLLKILKLNPKSPLERAMETKNMTELEALVKELKEQEAAFLEGFAEGKHSKDGDSSFEENDNILLRAMCVDLKSNPRALLDLAEKTKKRLGEQE